MTIAPNARPLAVTPPKPLPRALAPFAPTTSWTSNAFGHELAPASAAGTATGQLVPYGASSWEAFASSLALAGTALGAYHGYKRTESIGWTIGWALAGGLFPIIAIPVALAQGFGKPDPAFRNVRG